MNLAELRVKYPQATGMTREPDPDCSICNGTGEEILGFDFLPSAPCCCAYLEPYCAADVREKLSQVATLQVNKL